MQGGCHLRHLKLCIWGLWAFTFVKLIHAEKKGKKQFMLQLLHFDIHSVALRHWNEPLGGEYTVLLDVSLKFSGDLKPYFYSFSCYGYLWRGSWLEATINWVPPASGKHVSGWWRAWGPHTITRVWMNLCACMRRHSAADCFRGDSRLDTCVNSPSRGRQPLSTFH